MVKALHEVMPNFPTLSPMLLLSAWELLANLAEEQMRNMPKSSEVVEPRHLKLYAPLVPKSELVRMFSEALGLKRSVAEEILEFFSFTSAKSIDLWQQPLVEIDSDTICPVLPAIHSPNTLFMVEEWMRRGGVRLQDRGIDFENYERDVLVQAIAESALKEHAQVLPHAYKLIPEGDIDLVVRLGNTIICLELKCNLYPTRASQFHHHFEDLAKGARQINRKTVAVRANLEDFFQKTGWEFDDPKNVRFVPVVMTNLTLGSGMNIENVVVTDRWIFERYFSEGSLTQFAHFDLHTGREKGKPMCFYETPEQAEQNVEAYLHNPPQLAHYKTALSSTIYPIPSMGSVDCDWMIHHFEVDFEKIGLEGFNIKKPSPED